MILANEKNIDELYEIIKTCSKWLKELGIKQWDPVYPFELFTKDVQNQNVYFFTLEDVTIGTVTLYSNKPRYYPAELWNEAERSWYLCRFAVPRTLKSLNYGKKIFEEIKKEARNRGIKKIRIDIAKSNSFLVGYYRNVGFRKVAEGNSFNTLSVFMEKSL